MCSSVKPGQSDGSNGWMVTHKTYPIWSWCPSKVDTTIPLFSDDTIFLLVNTTVGQCDIISKISGLVHTAKNNLFAKMLICFNFFLSCLNFTPTPLVAYFLRIQARLYLQLFVDWLTSWNQPNLQCTVVSGLTESQKKITRNTG